MVGMAKNTPAKATTQEQPEGSNKAKARPAQGSASVRGSKARKSTSTTESKEGQKPASKKPAQKTSSATTAKRKTTAGKAQDPVERVPKKLAKSIGMAEEDRSKVSGSVMRAMAGDVPHKMQCIVDGVKKAKPPGSKTAKNSSGNGKNGPGIVEKTAPSHAGEAEPHTMLRVEDDPDLDVTKLPLKWQVFIEEYLIDYNATKAARRADYAETAAADAGYRISNDPRVAKIIRARTEDRLEAIRMTRERVLDSFADIAEADRNELSEHRRVCCPYCWGERDEATGAHAKQLTPGQWQRARDAWDERRLKESALSEGKVDIGDFQQEPGNWYDKRKPINPDCPECFGDGIGEIHLKDTRNLSKRARTIYEGTEEGKDGIKINTIKREVALQVLAKSHKIYDDAPTVNLTTIAPEELEAIYAKGTETAMEKKEAMKGRGDRVRASLKNGQGS